MFFLIQIIIELYMIRYIIIKIGKFFRNEKFFNKNNYLILRKLCDSKPLIYTKKEFEKNNTSPISRD